MFNVPATNMIRICIPNSLYFMDTLMKVNTCAHSSFFYSLSVSRYLYIYNVYYRQYVILQTNIYHAWILCKLLARTGGHRKHALVPSAARRWPSAQPPSWWAKLERSSFGYWGMMATSSSTLKMVVSNRSLPFWRGLLFRGYVSFRECKWWFNMYQQKMIFTNIHHFRAWAYSCFPIIEYLWYLGVAQLQTNQFQSGWTQTKNDIKVNC